MMSSKFRMLATLFSGARVHVLAALLNDPGRESYLREIARAAGVPLRAVQRELALYESIGLIRRRPRGREVYIAVDRTHPLFTGLRSLIASEAEMPGSAVPDPGAAATAMSKQPDASKPGSQAMPVSTPEPTPHPASESGPGPAQAVAHQKNSTAGMARKQPAPKVPSAEESWRVW